MATTAAGTPYVESSDLVANYPGVSLALANHIDATAGVLQVVSATSSTTVISSSTTFVTSGLAVTITPTLATSKILIFANTTAQNSSTAYVGYFTLFRGTVAGTNLGNGSDGMQQVYSNGSSAVYSPLAASYLDSPATTSATT